MGFTNRGEGISHICNMQSYGIASIIKRQTVPMDGSFPNGLYAFQRCVLDWSPKGIEEDEPAHDVRQIPDTFATLADLAAAQEPCILEEWKGLGNLGRARKCCVHCLIHHGSGEF